MIPSLFALISTSQDPDVAAALPRIQWALACQVSRFCFYSGISAPDIARTPNLSEIPKTSDATIVTFVDALDDPSALAYHTIDGHGRPVCFVSVARVRADHGRPDWVLGPDGLAAAASHEILETLGDPELNQVVIAPDGHTEFREVCDRLQSSDYEEPAAPGVYLANAALPAFWTAGSSGPWTLRGTLPTPSEVVAGPWGLMPGGYFEDASTGVDTFGELVPEHLRARVAKYGPRGGLRRERRG